QLLINTMKFSLLHIDTGGAKWIALTGIQSYSNYEDLGKILSYLRARFYIYSAIKNIKII
ncbi:hypothetical protein, partial [Shewanella oneidensis]|uniref:hypothetical protein n=1 Tax=Shewanella oneidensis TaxID=70863 RepID=UPI002E7AF0F9